MKRFKTTKTLAALLLVGFCAVGAQAQGLKNDGWYGEVGYLGMKIAADDGTSATPKLLRFTVGKEVMDNLAVEGMAGFTVSKASVLAIAPSTNGDVSDTVWGIYAKPHWAVVDGTDVFVRVGLAHNSFKESVSGSPDGTYSMTKFSYGLGVQTQFTKEIYGALDYMYYGKYSDEHGSGKHTGFTASIGYRF